MMISIMIIVSNSISCRMIIIIISNSCNSSSTRSTDNENTIIIKYWSWILHLVI